MDNSNDHNGGREELFSKAVRAGKRTYFFDVKATRKNDYYVTITESKKRFHDDGTFHYEKHKVFLYKEDFEKFTDGLSEVVNFINDSNNNSEIARKVENTEVKSEDFTNVNFEDLENE